jgi:ribonuclease P protein component
MIQSEPTSPRAPRAEALPREARILARADFVETYETGRRLPGRLLVVFARPHAGAGRLGVTATRKVGGAVVRNRARRRVREAYRRWRANRATGGGLDIVVNVSARAARAPYAVLAAELVGLLERASRGARESG